MFTFFYIKFNKLQGKKAENSKLRVKILKSEKNCLQFIKNVNLNKKIRCDIVLIKEEFMNYYNEIKNKLIDNEIAKKVKDYSKNRSDLNTYFEVGRLLIEAQGGEDRSEYGNKLIKEYSNRLTSELGKGYSITSLKYMRQFYLFKKGQPVADQLTWSHYMELLPLKSIDKINYYVQQIITYNLSKRELRNKIKSNEYERLPKESKKKYLVRKDIGVNDLIKNPIIIRNNYNYKEVSEKVLKKLILEDLSNFMKELGEGFCFIDSEYKIKIGNRYNYIDLLLYNIKYNCYTIVELKVTELKKEHIGQIQTYMNYINKNLKTINQDNTIGIIIVRKNNEFIMEYVSDNRIFETSYLLENV